MSPDAVHTLADLASRSRQEPSLAVLGHPIRHSVSPAMHNAALTRLAAADPRFGGWRYFKFDVDPADLHVALPLFLERGFIGLNLTVPHKVAAFGLVSDVDDEARPVGAVNTLVASNGRWRGFNTDGYGMESGILQDLSFGLKGRTVVLLGAGGAARGAAVQCLQSGVTRLLIVNRTAANRDALVAELAPLVRQGQTCEGLDPARLGSTLEPGALVINATSLGLRPDDGAPIDLARLPRPAAVYDMIYNPPQTALLRDAARLGIPCAHGLSMLVHQGAKALSLWTGARPSDLAPAMASGARAALGL